MQTDLSQIECGIGVIKDVMIPMRDGVNLAADIYRPTKNDNIVQEPFPTILERTPYNKEHKEMFEKADYFVKCGYIFIAQDNRGRFKSEDDFYPATNEAEL